MYYLFFSFHQIYEDDFPPEIMEEIFCPMASQDRDATSSSSLQHTQMLTKHVERESTKKDNIPLQQKYSSSPSTPVQKQRGFCQPFSCVTPSNKSNEYSTDASINDQRTPLASKRKISDFVEDCVIQKKRRVLRERMGRLLSYGHASPLSPLADNAASPACGKNFKTPKPNS